MLVALLVVAPASLFGEKSVTGTFNNENFHSTYTPTFESDGAEAEVKNVILMIGDGMGLTHVTSAMYANKGSLNITNLKVIGLVRTQSADNFTTDSAASGTAYATGQKTNNGYLGVDVDKRPIVNLPEKLAPLGYLSGVITTDYMHGATPSAFYAHQKDRGMSKEILGDLADSKLTFFAGGSAESIMKNRSKLYRELKRSGYVVAGTLDECSLGARKLGFIPTNRTLEAVKYPGEGDFLPSATEFGLEYLDAKNERGFFMMVEGARIDWSSHDNDFPSMIREMLDFDQAVEAAIRFADKDGHTLVIITADHETAGLTMSTQGDQEQGKVGGYFRNQSHSPVMVPLFAYGPQSHRFMGVQENSDVSNKIFEILSGILAEQQKDVN